jgi:putative MATE family efflux protein
MIKLKIFWDLLKRSIKGEDLNLLDGNLNTSIILLAIPMMLEMLMESLFAVVDIFFVSRIGVDAVAVVGLTESLLTIIYSLGIGLSMGATAMVARRVGEQKKDKAAIAGMQAIYLAVIVSVVIGIIGVIFSEELLYLMGASVSVIEGGSAFTKWMLGGNIIIMLLFLINGIFRGAGDAALAMRSLWLANGINILLDPIFIFGLGPIPALGVEGAAIATVTGRSCGVIYQLYHLFKGKGLIKIHRENFQFRWSIVKQLIKISAGGTGQFLIGSASWIFLMRLISGYGSTALAGYTIAIRVVIFTLLPAWGISNSASTMVGQNLGAGQPERAEAAVWRTGIINSGYMGIIMVIYLVFAEQIITFFTFEQDVIAIATSCLMIFSAGYIFYAFGMVITQSFNGSGDTKTPTILNFFIFWTFQIPLAYLLSKSFPLNPEGVFWAVPVSESILTIVAFLIFRKGKWKTVSV